MTERFSADAALAPLKRFQRATVAHVMRQLYPERGDEPDRPRRFLVADEVGMGKTMVARGVIASAIERMWDDVERIDIIYICSNSAIAAQNLARLNVVAQNARALPTRLTLLPLRLGGSNGLRANKVNFVSLTPGTTFELKSSTGIAEERALILRLLQPLIRCPEGASRLFQVGSGVSGWTHTRSWVDAAEVDDVIGRAFLEEIAQDQALTEKLNDLSDRFAAPCARADDDLRHQRSVLIGELRRRLARRCVDALEPDLIILDEFQRFPDLLHGETEAAELARALFDFRDAQGNAARTLLLSATPYRMLTLAGDAAEDGNHYEDFLEVLRFLFGPERSSGVVQSIADDMRRLRRAMLNLPASFDEARAIKTRVENLLREVIARTERVDIARDPNAMLSEPPHRLTVEPEDLREAVAISRVADVAGAPGVIEYWKSAPYLMGFMRDYKLKERLKDMSVAPPQALLEAIAQAHDARFPRNLVEQWQPVPLRNGRMRALSELVFRDGLAERLWIPPSLPYHGPRQDLTKALVFSAWSMVPDAIAALLSYEAERRMGVGRDGHPYAHRRSSRPLQFRERDGRLAGLRALTIVYPSPALARAGDPLTVLREYGKARDAGELRARVADRLRHLAGEIATRICGEGATETWDWAGPAMLDRLAGNATGHWLEAADGFRAIGGEDAWDDHVAALRKVAWKETLTGAAGHREIVSHLTDVALGSPAICALRALHRIAPDLAQDDPRLLTAAARVGMGFRTLFNQPEAQALLREESEDFYWRAVLRYCANQDLQAVLDEYVHVLLEAEGFLDLPGPDRVERIANVIEAALSLRPAQIDVDDLSVRNGSIHLDRFQMRGRFAVRLAPKAETENGESRTGLVRTAFNSPFRPFVLATTSIGQEGLDFHTYCHRVVHWNLPSNPVDMEQREGRVHRYKNHAVRLNVAAAHAAVLRASSANDPWQEIFDHAWRTSCGTDDLHPFWIHEGDSRIERHVLALPFSREETRLGQLKRSVALYRMAFGQPRQDDLLGILDRASGELDPHQLSWLQICLRPPPCE